MLPADIVNIIPCPVAKWELDLFKDDTKYGEESAKNLAAEAKAAQVFWGETWGHSKGAQVMLPLLLFICFSAFL